MVMWAYSVWSVEDELTSVRLSSGNQKMQKSEFTVTME